MNEGSAPQSPEDLVLLITRDQELCAALAPLLAKHGLSLVQVETSESLVERLSKRSYDRVGRIALTMVDTSALEDPGDIGTLAGAAALQVPPIPFACLATNQDIRYRLAALRAGAVACVPGGQDPSRIAARLVAALDLDRDGPDRVLVVDDQPVAALFAARVLEEAGMVAHQVCDPLAVLESMERFNPDLVLMDLHMPGASGIELTRIIREHERYSDLPIVFLSGEMDPRQQLDALRVGGDDFLAKPVSPTRLVERVRSRLDEVRRRAERRTRDEDTLDPLTGLVTRAGLLERLDGQIRARVGSRSAAIYLELKGDDGLLPALAEAVRALIDPSDLAARASEDGVAVVARRADSASLVAFVDSLAQGVHQALAASGGGANPIPLGVGWCPLSASGHDSVTLVARARMAARASLRRQGRVERYSGFRRREESGAAAERVTTAIQSESLQLLFQPMVPLRGPMIQRYEAAPRLHTSDGDLLAPKAFVPIARSAGLLGRLDAWTLATGLDTLAECHRDGCHVELFLHQSMAGIAADDWVDRLREGIAERDLIRLRPVIQLEAEEVEQDLDLARRRAGELAHLGIRLCLNGLAEEPRAEALVEALPLAYARLVWNGLDSLEPAQLLALVELFHDHGALAIAGGVESPETVARLHPARVDLVQGPFVQPPMETLSFDFSTE